MLINCTVGIESSVHAGPTYFYFIIM